MSIHPHPDDAPEPNVSGVAMVARAPAQKDIELAGQQYCSVTIQRVSGSSNSRSFLLVGFYRWFRLAAFRDGELAIVPCFFILVVVVFKMKGCVFDSVRPTPSVFQERFDVLVV